MMQQLFLAGEIIEYAIEHSTRARRSRFTMHAGGELVVTAPVRVSLDRIEALVRAQERWILRQRARQLARPVQVLPAVSDSQSYRTHKKNAEDVVRQHLATLTPTERLRPHTVTIKNHRTRWGSCSKQGNLNFNYRIAFLPFELARYIIVHEICHLYELNHSRAFWSHVARLIPDYRICRVRLREYIWKKV